MDSSWLCYGVFGVWCNLNISSLDSLPRPPIFGEMVKLAQISPKIRRCPHSPTSRSQTAQLMKTGKYSFDRGIITLHFGEKNANLHLPILEEVWWTGTSFISERHSLLAH